MVRAAAGTPAAAKNNKSSFEIGDFGQAKRRNEVARARSKVHVVLLATSYGGKFLEDIEGTASYTHLVSSSQGEVSHVTKGLLDLSRTPVINHWLLALKGSTRLAPLEESVYIVCNDDNQDEFRDWAQQVSTKDIIDIPPDHIVSNGFSKGGERQSKILDVADVLIAKGIESHVVIVNLDYIFEPDLNFTRLIEHAMIRARDVAVCIPAWAGLDLSEIGVCELSSTAVASAKITACNAHPEGTANGTEWVYGPLLFIRNDTLPDLYKFADSEEGGEFRSLALFGQHLCRTKGLYALKTPFLFGITDLKSYEYISGFFAFYSRKKKSLYDKFKVKDSDSNISLDHNMAPSTETPFDRQLKAMEKELGLTRKDLQLKQAIDSGALEIEELRQEYDKVFFGSKVPSSVTSVVPARAIPERFKDAHSWKQQPKPQHAVFQTSNNMYGKKAPSQQEMPMKWYGIRGNFTKTFQAKYSDTSFNTSRSASNVHKSMDDF